MIKRKDKIVAQLTEIEFNAFKKIVNQEAAAREMLGDLMKIRNDFFRLVEKAYVLDPKRRYSIRSKDGAVLVHFSNEKG